MTCWTTGEGSLREGDCKCATSSGEAVLAAVHLPLDKLRAVGRAGGGGSCADSRGLQGLPRPHAPQSLHFCKGEASASDCRPHFTGINAACPTLGMHFESALGIDTSQKTLRAQVPSVDQGRSALRQMASSQKIFLYILGQQAVCLCYTTCCTC